MNDALKLALIGSATSLLVAGIGFFAAVRAAKVAASFQAIRGPIEHEYKRAQLQSGFLRARLKDSDSRGNK